MQEDKQYKGGTPIDVHARNVMDGYEIEVAPGVYETTPKGQKVLDDAKKLIKNYYLNKASEYGS